MKPSIWMWALLALGGCATQSAAVRCDSRLEPINMPASKETPENAVDTPSTLGSVEGEDGRE